MGKLNGVNQRRYDRYRGLLVALVNMNEAESEAATASVASRLYESIG